MSWPPGPNLAQTWGTENFSGEEGLDGATCESSEKETTSLSVFNASEVDQYLRFSRHPDSQNHRLSRSTEFQLLNILLKSTIYTCHTNKSLKTRKVSSKTERFL